MSIDGIWHLAIESPIGKQHVTVDLKDGEGALSGTLTNDENNMTTDIFDGVVNGSALQWKVKLQQMKMTLAFDMKISDDSMTGKVKAGLLGKFNAVGERER